MFLRCEQVAALGLVLKTRVPWHVEMQAFLGGLRDDHPGPPPDIPPPDEVCLPGTTSVEVEAPIR